MHAAAALALISALLHPPTMRSSRACCSRRRRVLGATGERNMERLGGLIRVMPATTSVPGRVLLHHRPAAVQTASPSEWLILQRSCSAGACRNGGSS